MTEFTWNDTAKIATIRRDFRRRTGETERFHRHEGLPLNGADLIGTTVTVLAVEYRPCSIFGAGECLYRCRVEATGETLIFFGSELERIEKEVRVR